MWTYAVNFKGDRPQTLGLIYGPVQTSPLVTYRPGNQARVVTELREAMSRAKCCHRTT